MATITTLTATTSVNGRTSSVEQITIEGRTIQIDMSGKGHDWRNATAETCGRDTQDEIAAEIIDGGVDSCVGYRGANGLWYRWR